MGRRAAGLGVFLEQRAVRLWELWVARLDLPELVLSTLLIIKGKQ